VGQVRLHRHHRPDLLAGRDQQRCVVGLGVEDRPHRVGDAARGVAVYVADAPRRLRVAVRHPDDDRLLEAEHVAEVLWKVTEHRQLGRAGVAEDRRHPPRPQKLEGGFPNRAHLILSLAAAGSPTLSRELLRTRVEPRLSTRHGPLPLDRLAECQCSLASGLRWPPAPSRQKRSTPASTVTSGAGGSSLPPGHSSPSAATATSRRPRSPPRPASPAGSSTTTSGPSASSTSRWS